MKIALLGAPGSQKSLIARRLSARLNKETKSWRVIDGYVDKLQQRTGAQFGADQSIWAFRYHIQVLGERWTLEDEATHAGLSSITCGSIYESIIYAAAQGANIPFLGDEQLMLDETHIANLMMQSLGVLATRTFDYDILFYLPLTVDDPQTWSGVINAKLPEILDGQYKVAVPLTGTDRQKVNRAEETIHHIATEIAAYEQHAVRSGDEVIQGDEPQPELVPDMSPETS